MSSEENKMFTWEYILRRGHSKNPFSGACAMDAVSWLVYGRHGDTPECVSPVIATYVRNGNDLMPDDVRQRLLPYLHRIAGSRSGEHEGARLRIVILATARLFAARAMHGAGLLEIAAALRSIPDDASYCDIKDLCLSIAASCADASASSAACAAASAASCARASASASTYADTTSIFGCASAAIVHSVRSGCAWDDYFTTLDMVIKAGPEGEPWSADARDAGVAAYISAGGLVEAHE